jgi:cGMP-dependent protein kinase
MMIDHVFIMKLVKTFKDTKRVYFLTEFINGLDLFDVLRKIGICKEPEARFYTAVFVLVLEHLA